MTDTQLLHKANGILRIRQAIKNCDLPCTSKGSIYSLRLRGRRLTTEELFAITANATYS